jgi:hypothetical protein
MRTITVIAYRRPDYLAQSLQALLENDLSSWDQVLVQIDPGFPEVGMQAREFSSIFKNRVANYLVHENLWRMGVSNNPRKAINYVFGLGSDFNVSVEDDCLLSPDALDLALWFEKHGKDYLFLNLSSKNIAPGLFDDLEEHPGMMGAFGWACTRQSWFKIIEPTWNGKIREPYGWDWSLTYQCVVHELITLFPTVSRTFNIGKFGGMYDTPSNWVKTQLPIVAADRSPGNYDFKIAKKLSPGWQSRHKAAWITREEMP